MFLGIAIRLLCFGIFEFPFHKSSIWSMMLYFRMVMTGGTGVGMDGCRAVYFIVISIYLSVQATDPVKVNFSYNNT